MIAIQEKKIIRFIELRIYPVHTVKNIGVIFLAVSALSTGLHLLHQSFTAHSLQQYMKDDELKPFISATTRV
jgi:hypothetical protein